MTQRQFTILLLAGLLLAGCSTPPVSLTVDRPVQKPPLIPYPVSVTDGSGSFMLSPSTVVAVAGTDTRLHAVGQTMAEQLGLELLLDFLSPAEPVDSNRIILRLSADIRHPQGYRIRTTQRSIIIESAQPVGAFYAFQTLRQMLTPEAYMSGITAGTKQRIPAGVIEDQPRFRYRGMHLDVARHMFPVAFIKKYIDLLAMFKLNTFHWHLTDDQGWRIEIAKYPKLTEVGAWRKETLVGHYTDRPERFDGTPYGGYYTQDEVRDVVAYARERFVTIIPEIEMPGHAQAALAAYPELSCTYGPHDVATKWGVFKDIFCTKDSVFTFLEDVLTEVIDLFPGEYIHVGGDEAPKDRWEVCPNCRAVREREGIPNVHAQQSYFINRIEKFLNSKGRRVIGWDEILEEGISPGATVMSWRGEIGGIKAAQAGHDVVMSPTSHVYFDFYQGSGPEEPLAIGSFLPLRKVYDYNPVPQQLTAAEAQYILGAQANVWTEYIPTEKHVEYMVLPRLTALAEAVWTPQGKRGYEDFADRLARSLWRLDSLGYEYAKHILDVDYMAGPARNGITLFLTSRDEHGVVRYTTDGTDPGPTSTIYLNPLELAKDTPIRAARFRGTQRSDRILRLDFTMHKAAGKPIGLGDSQPHPTFGYRGRSALVNGIRGSDTRFMDGEWLGWYRWHMDATIDLLEETRVNSVSLRFFNNVPEWIWLPKVVKISVSDDGRDFREVTEFTAFDHGSPERTVTVTIPLNGIRTQFLKVYVPNYGIIPDEEPGAGEYTWLFVDEIVVQ